MRLLAALDIPRDPWGNCPHLPALVVEHGRRVCPTCGCPAREVARHKRIAATVADINRMLEGMRK